MLRAAASSALSLCIFAGAALTLAGALAPLVPEWEMINHFRPYIAAGFTAMLAFAFVLGSRTLMLTALAFNALNAALLLVPVTLQASTAPRSSAPRFKLITFNVYAGNHDFDVTARFLREADADIVVLQEVTHKHGDNLLPDLRDLYPYQLSCDRTIRCGLAILSKTPWTEADFSAGDRDRPPLIWARFGTDAEGHRVAGTQFGTPLRPAYQVRNGRWLAEWCAGVAEPLIVAGDFNLTPFTWLLTKFALHTGLRRYATFQASWPALDYRPAFLIDHIFSSEDFHPIEVHTGTDLGSYLPLIAEIAFRTEASGR